MKNFLFVILMGLSYSVVGQGMLEAKNRTSLFSKVQQNEAMGNFQSEIGEDITTFRALDVSLAYVVVGKKLNWVLGISYNHFMSSHDFMSRTATSIEESHLKGGYRTYGAFFGVEVPKQIGALKIFYGASLPIGYRPSSQYEARTTVEVDRQLWLSSEVIDQNPGVFSLGLQGNISAYHFFNDGPLGFGVEITSGLYYFKPGKEYSRTVKAVTFDGSGTNINTEEEWEQQEISIRSNFNIAVGLRLRFGDKGVDVKS